MRKPVVFICGVVAAYSIWKWLSYSFRSSSYRKKLDDDDEHVLNCYDLFILRNLLSMLQMGVD